MATVPSYSLLINGVDLSSHMPQSSFSIQQNFGRQGDTASFSLYDEITTTAPNFVVKPLQSIVLTDTNLGTVMFGGLVTNPKWVQEAPNLIRWDLQCVDYTYYANKIIVHGIFVGQTADAIIKDLVTLANVGLTTNNVQPGPTIDRIKINYLTLSGAISKVTKMATQSTNSGWYIDETK